MRIKGSAAERKRRITIAELSAQPDDPPGIMAIFAEKKFSAENFIQNMVSDPSTLKDYLKSLESARGIPGQVQATLDFITVFKTMKACFCFSISVVPYLKFQTSVFQIRMLGIWGVKLAYLGVSQLPNIRI